MKLSSQEILFEKYPDLFIEKDLPRDRSCMCLGLEIGDGWIKIMDDLCFLITERYKQFPGFYPQIIFTQVKEKFGLIRIYYRKEVFPYNEFKKNQELKNSLDRDTPKIIRFLNKIFLVRTKYLYKKYLENTAKGIFYIDGFISMAEKESERTCEVCGNPGEMRSINRWLKLLCKSCYRKHIRGI